MNRGTGTFLLALALSHTPLESQQISHHTHCLQEIGPEGFVSANRSLVEQRFALTREAGDRFDYEFHVTRPGTIRLEARWVGGADRLRLVLNAPGEAEGHAVEVGASPLVIELDVERTVLDRGDDWSVSILSLDEAPGDEPRSAVGWLLVQHPTEVDWQARPVGR